MKNLFSQLRYWLEFIAFPTFFLLVTHLVGHGAMLLLEPGHEHNHEHETEHAGHGIIEEIFEKIATPEIIIGLMGAVFIYLIWQKTSLKKFIPCNHEHCHAGTQWWHIGAIIALCLHFFPEAILRQELLNESSTATFAQIAFTSHFFIDIFVAAAVSNYWPKNWQKIVSFGAIAITWIIAFKLAQNVNHLEIPHTLNGFIHLISGFILGMFVHLPHKTKVCKKCKD